MKVLITGASSGLGADMARVLNSMGCELILVARRKTRLEKLQKELGENVTIEIMDISSTFNCMKLYNKYKKENIDILINNAGFGVYGDFTTTSIDKELDMIDINIKTVHTLTKLFLTDFKKKDKGYILNVASSAAFLPGPLMASYYASKAYVFNLTMAINEELRQSGSNVYIGALCPGPVDTEFNKVAKCTFSIKGLDSYRVSEYAIKKMFKKKMIIIPGFSVRLGISILKLLPMRAKLSMSYEIQNGKNGPLNLIINLISKQ